MLHTHEKYDENQVYPLHSATSGNPSAKNDPEDDSDLPKAPLIEGGSLSGSPHRTKQLIAHSTLGS